MIANNYHWYDGWFYDTFIAPNQDKMFSEIKEIIDPGVRIIDVGCGTGRFSFSVAEKCGEILGIDLSKINIAKANQNLSINPISNIFFQHSGVTDLIKNHINHFDYAVLTYVIHEVNKNKRVNLLHDISVIADKIIIGDYLVPMSHGFPKWITHAVEFFAGKEHYRNFRNYIANGGIYYLAEKADMKIIYEKKNKLRSSHLVILTKQKKLL